MTWFQCIDRTLLDFMKLCWFYVIMLDCRAIYNIYPYIIHLLIIQHYCNFDNIVQSALPELSRGSNLLKVCNVLNPRYFTATPVLFVGFLLQSRSPHQCLNFKRTNMVLFSRCNTTNVGAGCGATDKAPPVLTLSSGWWYHNVLSSHNALTYEIVKTLLYVQPFLRSFCLGNWPCLR